MNPSPRIRHLSSGIALLLAIALQQAAKGSVLDCLTPNNDGVGYDQFAWTGMTADLNTANGAALATTEDLSNLPLLMSFTGLWVDVRQPGTGTLNPTETANLQAFIASGRRVVLIGGPGPQAQNSNFASWNDAILSAVGGPAGTTFFSTVSSNSYPASTMTAGVSSIAIPAGAVAASGVTLFADRVATLWGPARNALVLLDTATLGDDNLAKMSDAGFASNVAAWIAGNQTDGPSQWQSTAGGNWQTSANWQFTQQPNVGDDAVFNLGSAGYTITAAAPVTARNLIVSNDRVTIDLPGASGNLTLAQGISVALNASSASSLVFTNSSGADSAVVAATSLSIGGSGAGTLSIASGVQAHITGGTNIAAGSTLSINGGQLWTTNFAADGAVAMTAGGIHIASTTPAGILNTIGSLTIASGATFDVGNTDLDLGDATLASTASEIASGYANGSWTGTGITSSAAAADPAHLSSLGVIVNNDGSGHPIFGVNASMGPFDGTNPAFDDILVKYTDYGDANLDGKVDGSDYTRIDHGFDNHLTGWINGDFNYDGVVDGSDYTLIDNAFNTQSTGDASVVAAAQSGSVPEPAAAVLGIGLMVLRRRQRAR